VLVHSGRKIAVPPRIRENSLLIPCYLGILEAGRAPGFSNVGAVKARDVFFSALNDPSFFRQELHTFGTARARVGFAFDQVLVYATGGLAGANFTDRVAFLRNTDNAFQFVGRRSTTEYGYTVGGGVEFSLPESLRQFAFIGNLLNASAVTVRAEYLYFDLGDRNVLVNAVPGVGLNSYTTRFESTGHIGRIGFNYRFGT
jgi:outer membrane immunogenic protein